MEPKRAVASAMQAKTQQGEAAKRREKRIKLENVALASSLVLLLVVRGNSKESSRDGNASSSSSDALSFVRVAAMVVMVCCFVVPISLDLSFLKINDFGLFNQNTIDGQNYENCPFRPFKINRMFQNSKREEPTRKTERAVG